MSVRRGDHEADRLPSSRSTAVFAGGSLLVATAVLLLGWAVVGERFSESHRELLSNVITALLLVSIPLASARAALRAHGATRLAWKLMALAGVFWALAQFTYFYELYVAVTVSSPPVSDLLFLLALLPAGASLLAFPTSKRLGRQRIGNLLGAVVVIAALLYVSRSLALSVMLPTDGEPLVLRTTLVAWPLADVVLASCALTLLTKSVAGPPLHLILLGLGFLTYAVGDTVYLRAEALGTYAPGTVLDVVWALGYALVVLSALAPSASRDPDAGSSSVNEDRIGGLSSLVIYLPLLVAVLVAVRHPPSLGDPLLLVSGTVALVVFGFRQALLAADTSRLRRDLLYRVTELEERGLALRQLARQNEQILQSVVDGVLGVDAAGRVTFVNDRAAAMLGRPALELIGTDERDLFADLSVSAGLSVGTEPRGSAVARALATETVVRNSRARFRRAGGSDFPVELAVGPVRDGDAVTGGVVVFRDVSERLAVEKMKNEFVSVVSHELRTPLTSIRGSLGLLAGGKGGVLTPPGERMVSIALGSSERLTRLIEDMLDIERMESGSLALSMVTCEAADLVGTALNVVEGVASQYGMTLRSGSVAGCVRGDADRVVQVLTNLLGNAIKFSSPGGTIEVSSVVGETMVEFAVADQGRGVPDDKMLTIFERFEQVDSSDSRERGGTGLGLAISRDIVRLHGGRIWVEGGRSGGATFRFTVPRAHEPQLSTSVGELADVGQGLVV